MGLSTKTTCGMLGAKYVKPTFRHTAEIGPKAQLRCRMDSICFVRNVIVRGNQTPDAPVEGSSTALEQVLF